MAKETNREEDGFFAEATDQENVFLLCLFPFPWYLLKVEKCDQCCTMRRFQAMSEFSRIKFSLSVYIAFIYIVSCAVKDQKIYYNMLCATSEFAIFFAVSQTTRNSNFNVYHR